MSKYTREEILKLIEENGGPEGLDLSGKDLSGIDLSREAIEGELEKARKRAPDEKPVWVSEWPGGINLAGAKLRNAILISANLQEAGLSIANLQGAFLVDANLRGANLWNANLHKANLVGANLQGVWLAYSHLEKMDFFGAESLEGAYFYNAFLDDTRIKREQLGDAIGEELERNYDWAKEAYLALKNNFAEIGRYRDESWAYVKERQMEKMMNHPRLACMYYRDELPENPSAWRLKWFYVRHTAKWALDWVVEWTCGYGENVLKTLRAMGVALGIFAVLYRLLGAVVDVNGNPSSGWLHCLLYSGGAFTTFGVDALRPANDWIRALSIFESVVGIALTGLLGFVLGNRIRRS